MQFPSFFQKKQTDENHFFALFLKSESAVGFIFEKKDNAISIVAQESCNYSNGWENILEDIDKLISILETQADVTLEKVIFFVYSYIVDAETSEIKKPYKDIIKNIVKQLALKPMGFIELHEAVKEYLVARDQAPLNSVFIELDSIHAGVYVYKGGKSVFVQHTSRTDELSDDISDVLKSVSGQGHLPSKMVVYGMPNIKSEVKALHHQDWDDSMFIQQPRISVLEEDELYKAFVDVFAEQILEMSEKEEEEIEDEVPVGKPETLTEEPEKEVMGFFIGEDVPKEYKQEEVKVKPSTKVATKTKVAHPKKLEEEFIVGPDVDTDEEEEKESPAPQKRGLPVIKMPQLSEMPKVSMPSLPKLNLGKGAAIWIAVAVVFFLSLVLIDFLFHKTSIIVYLPAQQLAKSIDLSVPISSSSDSELTIQANTLSSDLNETKATTGEREIGDKAKGDVMLMNFDNVSRSLPRGTKLSAGSLVFTLDQDATIASSSGITSGGAKQAGKTKASITAQAIGPESNLAQGKQLSISGLSDALYMAMVDTGLKGGTRKKIRTVSKKDVEALKSQLTEKAKGQNNDALKSQVSKENVMIDAMTEVKMEDKNITYSKEVGEEADEVTAKATAVTTYYTYGEKQMQNSILSTLKSEVQSGMKMQEAKLVYKIDKAKKTNDNTCSMTVSGSVAAIKDVNTDDVMNTIKGKSVSSLNSILSDKFSAESYELGKDTSSIPLLSNWVAFFKKNIKVSISSK